LQQEQGNISSSGINGNIEEEDYPEDMIYFEKLLKEKNEE
tara:strand:- start:41 stop:160 length:120 start_codon:yes stop_codon:yes gene_type:complete